MDQDRRGSILRVYHGGDVVEIRCWINNILHQLRPRDAVGPQCKGYRSVHRIGNSSQSESACAAYSQR